MNAREDILADVRRALAAAPSRPAPVPRDYRRDATSGPGTIDLFVERVADYRAVVVRCHDSDVESEVAAALPPGARPVVPEGFPWRVVGALDDVGLTARDLDAVDAVVTTASVGIAETGTIVLTHGAGEGRRALTLVPDLHVCVIRADQVVPGVPEAVSRLDPGRPTTWVSGPSATSDIELDRVEGVHGPRTLHIIVVC